MTSGQVPPLSPWRWLRRACGYGPLVGGLSSVVTLIEWTILVAFFALTVAIPFGIVCRFVVGAEPAGWGLIAASGFVPFFLIALTVEASGPLAEEAIGRAQMLAFVAAGGCAATTALLIRRDNRRCLGVALGAP